MSRPRYPTIPTTGLMSSSRDAEKRPALKPPPGYVLDWNAYTSRRRNLADLKELRAELLRQSHRGGDDDDDGGGGEEKRLVVVSGGGLHDDGLVEVLRAAGGVEGGLLECHRERRGYRGKRGRGFTGWWWSWEYPELEVIGRPLRGGHPRMRCFGRVSLWRGSGVSILILPDRIPPTDSIKRRQPPPPPPPPLRHQDAMSNSSTLRQQHYGTVDEYAVPRISAPPILQQQQQHETIETAVWDSLGDGVPLEEVLGELVYERWVRLFERLTSANASDGGLDDEVNRALEMNMDCARVLEKQGRPLAGVSLKDWDDLLSRAHRRFLLSARHRQTHDRRENEGEGGRGEDEDGQEEQRSLDRISYLGGILLPVTVVSSVLAIEGNYGPEGNSFWVFWVASLVASVVTILVIHIDRVRSLQVWMEVAADTVMESGGLMAQEAGRKLPSEVVVRRRRRMQRGEDTGEFGIEAQEEEEEEEEEEIKAYRRKKLGWGGAVKQVSGYYRWKGQPGMAFRVPRDEDM